MRHEKFYEGFIITTGNTLFEDKIDSYVAFDIAGKFDWITFDAGCLTKHHVLDNDRIQVFADDALLFVHPKPDCPEEADLIDLCGRPYFHFVGRYLSSLNNFDINDCFKDGSTKRDFFDMKDGSKIYKGVMLETNIPLKLEDVSLKDVVFVCMIRRRQTCDT